MMALAILVSCALCAIAFSAGWVLARTRAAQTRALDGAPHDTIENHALEEHGGSSFVRFDPIASRGTRSTALDDQDEAWRTEMLAIGARLRASNVGAIVFVHGTFAGDDPLGIARLARRALPRTGPRLEKLLRDATRARLHAALGDLGNYGEAYVSLFERAIGGDIPCTRFEWSSENHHLARLRASIDLTRVLAVHAEHAMGQRARIVLVGHSHAGQIFALLSHFLAGGGEAAALLDVARVRGVDARGLREALRTLDGHAIDVVTQGAASRYRFTPPARMRAMHLVNERDAVRRVASHGSDFPPASASERALNARLVPLLGEATDARALLRSAIEPMRPDPVGHTYFVDYGGRFWRDGAGHGVYTRLDAMLFNARLMVDHFYPASDAA